jgi:hypothetical protein
VARNEKLAELSKAGVAVWLDDLSRDLIRSGALQSLVDDHSVVGVTTRPLDDRAFRAHGACGGTELLLCADITSPEPTADRRVL